MFKLLILFFLTVIPVRLIAAQFELRSRDGIVEANKYYFGQSPVWTDSDKQKIIDNSVGNATGAITDSDFTPVVFTQSQQDAITEIQTEGRTFSVEKIKAKMAEHETKAHLWDKHVAPLAGAIRAKIDAAQFSGIEISTATEQADFDKFMSQYQAATK